MKQLIYRSQPFGFDEATLAGILSGARRNNRRDDITGARRGRPELTPPRSEGPAAASAALNARSAVDDRHGDVRLLLTGDVRARMFPQWEMLDDRSPSLSWSPAEIAAGAIEAAGPDDLLGVFARLAAGAGSLPASR